MHGYISSTMICSLGIHIKSLLVPLLTIQGLSLIFLLLPCEVFAQNHLGPLRPFFFLCNFHGSSQEYGLDSGQVVVSVHIEGDPRGYVPNTFYNISISSSETFDSLLMTGLYTAKASQGTPRPRSTTGVSQSGTSDVMCSILHSQVSPRPMKKLTFTWMAPPTGTGCVNFLATATHGQQLLFKDTSIAQLCEQGVVSIETLRPDLTGVNTESILLRDDFKIDTDFDPDVWTSVEGGYIGDECGTLVNGGSAIFCNSEGTRKMVTSPLNLTAAHILQFSLGGGGCRPHKSSDQDIIIGYGTDGCTQWIPLERIKAPTSDDAEMHLVTLPKKARQAGTCIMLYQPSNTPGGFEDDPFMLQPYLDVHFEHLSDTASRSSESTSTTDSYSTTLITKMTNKPITTTQQSYPTTQAGNETDGYTQLLNAFTLDEVKNIPLTTRQTTEQTSSQIDTTEDEETTIDTVMIITTTQLPSTTLSSTNPETTAPRETRPEPSINDSLLMTTLNSSDPTDLDASYNLTFLDFIPNDEPYGERPSLIMSGFHRCWNLDNIVIVNTAHPPKMIHEDFDPIDPSDWIFFPGAVIDQRCQSHGNVFVFEDRNQTMTYATTRELDLDIEDLEKAAHFYESFDHGETKVTFEGGHISSSCGVIKNDQAVTFNGAKLRRMCSPPFSLKDVNSARFYFQFGGDCKASKTSNPVLVYLEDGENHTHVLDSLDASSYLTHPVFVSQPFTNASRSSSVHGQVKFCLLQKTHGGLDIDVWVVDDLALLPSLPDKSTPDADKVFQASLNLNCGNGADGAESLAVNVEYSADRGRNWHNFYSPCLPFSCPNGHYSTLSSYISGKNMFGWDRITLPLPYSALGPHTRFRVVQHDAPAQGMWAMDDVFVGPCKNWCSGQGICTLEGCSCDFGFEGPECQTPVSDAPSTWEESFEDQQLLSTTGTVDTYGGVVGYLCGVLSSGKALVFNNAGRRMLTSGGLNTEHVSHIQFTIRVGSRSVKSTCRPPDQTWESVLLDVSCNGGISWDLLGHFDTSQYNRPMSVSTPLPDIARGSLCKFRWWQPHHSGQNQDVWAIDDISLVSSSSSNDPSLNPSEGDTSVPGTYVGASPRGATVLAVEMMDSQHLDLRVATNLGKLEDSFCGRMRSLKFSNPEENGEARALKTRAMRVGPGYIAQFELVMGCGVPYTPGLDNQIYFQYSVDHGLTWRLVEEVCLPPDVCSSYTEGSVYHHSKFGDWRTVTVVLPPDTWGQQTLFRWIQPEWSKTDVWAVSRVYVGHPCNDHCLGHGECHLGVCRCKKGYSGDTCTPDFQLDAGIQADFGHRYDPTSDFKVTGGQVVRSDQGCGIILSGESLFFYKDGVRELETKDLNTAEVDFLQFWVQLGGDAGSDKTTLECSGADRRVESLLVRYSVDGGVSWSLLSELDHRDHSMPKFVHLELPESAKTNHTRFQWWQPQHSGPGTDQWALDGVLLSSYKNYRQLEDGFDDKLDLSLGDQWRVVTGPATGKYCGRVDPSLVLSNQLNDKIVISQDVSLSPGDVLQFGINVDCGKQFRWDHPVVLQYSHDQGHTWSLVEEPCYLSQECDGKLTEGTIYYTGTHGQWTLVVIPISDKIAMQPTIFRWWQPSGIDHSFALDDVYIGPPCLNNCNRRGVCKQGKCHCINNRDDATSGEDCSPVTEALQGMLDRFDNQNMPLMSFWERVQAGSIGKGCGQVDHGDSLYFSGDGTREARTRPLNTLNKKALEFTIKIGDNHHSMTCRPPDNRDEGVIVDFSTDNGITWSVLEHVQPTLDGDVKPQTILLDLPTEAKTNGTVFRFWQPLGLNGMPRAEWAIDSVLVGINQTNRFGFEDTFKEPMPDATNWFLADAASSRQTCGSKDAALEFSHMNGYQIAETWDYHVTPSTFLQFDLALNCGSLASDLYDVRLEFSLDHGRTWQPVVDECKPPHMECQGYHLSSTYPSAYFGNWTRVTVALPKAAVSPNTRFRWLRPGSEQPHPIWAIDNIYLGSECPWLCSGHGVCHDGKCLCDPGFGGEFCVATKTLPMALRDDFNSKDTNSDVWEVYGGSNSQLCGPVVTDRSMSFDQEGLRMAVTRDMDTTMLTHMEFYFRYGCGDATQELWQRQHSVLLQYSTTGGILWKLLREIHYPNQTEPRFFSISLPMKAKHNATRFRFWQASNAGAMNSVWSVDNLFIGPGSTRPPSVFDTFQSDAPLDPMAWNFINNGQLDEFCTMHKIPNQNFPMGDDSALVFRRFENGEISAETLDLDLGPMSVLQFDINVGCGAAPRAKYPVRLEYSMDGGLSWELVGPDCTQETTSAHAQKSESTTSACYDSKVPATVYYAGESVQWRRVVVPLDHIRVCGPLRFRWHQGKIPDNDFGPEWALDNVYIGMACMDHCNGHGYCIAGMMCQCDKGFSGPLCTPEEQLPQYLKEDFGSDPPKTTAVNKHLPLFFEGNQDSIDDNKWSILASGHITDDHKCGKIFMGSNFVQDSEGERSLTTAPLDLTKANTIQFHIRLGCNKTIDSNSPPVYLQYSTNGGIYWTTIEQFEFSEDNKAATYIAVNIPDGANKNPAQIRWWQPSRAGKHSEDWAIDQIYIGGNKNGEQYLQDAAEAPSNTTWLEHPGATLEAVCGSDTLALHFTEKEKERYANTADVRVGEGSVIQFSIAMGCDHKTKDTACFDVRVEYSLKKGREWRLLRPTCLPSSVECGDNHQGSILSSDAYTGWKFYTMKIPRQAWSDQTRFRLYQAPNYRPDDTWAVKWLYVGWECPASCHGRGRCSGSQCVCDKGWSGHDCSVSDKQMSRTLIEDFVADYDSNQWDRVVGGSVTQPCRPVASGKALQFYGKCSRLLETKALDLTSTLLVQFYFLYGCNSPPLRRDESVLVEFTTDGGVTWRHLAEMHFDLYRTPTFVSLPIPAAAKYAGGTKIRWRQPQHDAHDGSDWLIDNVRILGDPENPEQLNLNFTQGLDFNNVITRDGIKASDYCGKSNVAVGQTLSREPSTLTTRDVKTTEDHALYFSINVGCGQSWDANVSPVDVSFSTDNGVTWTDLVSHCLDQCTPHSAIAHQHHHGTHDNWRSVAIKLDGLSISNGTRFRWQQTPNGMSGGQDWGLADVYIGRACPHHCNGRGQCFDETCHCDAGVTGLACDIVPDESIKTYMKDTFDKPGGLDPAKWLWAQGAQVQEPPCGLLVSGQSLVSDGLGVREVVTSLLDLRDARFVQYTVQMWSQKAGSDRCESPTDDKSQSVYLQYSSDGGVTWHTIHALSPEHYTEARHDYIPLPAESRTENSQIRWIQSNPLSTDHVQRNRVHWALDDVYIGGTEINPAAYRQNFDTKADKPLADPSDLQGDDPNAWEFNPYGILGLEGNPCSGDSSDSVGSSAMVWLHDSSYSNPDSDRPPVQMFTTNQMIVQAGYMMQFNIIIGCGQHQDICSAPSTPVKLQYRREPSTDHWSDVQASCLPGSQGRQGLCNPHKHHLPSHYRISDAPVWTRVTIPLNEVVFSSTTQFRWIQDGSNGTLTWALDDIYIGEECPDLCRGRGDCVHGVCVCDSQYTGPTCSPPARSLPTRLFDSFEGGVFPSRWSHVRGGGLGFGCGALLPYAHGKTLYFNGCGSREAVTAEMDTTHAIKIIFVIQIGCYAQTHDCNIELSEGPSYKGVLLQYSTNKGADWYFIAQHDPSDFLRPKKVAYDIPIASKAAGTQFRWWQPSHGGHGFDQWAIDHVEIIAGRRRYNRRRWRHRG